MRLSEALSIIARSGGVQQERIDLLCGFEAWHFASFVRAHLLLRHPEKQPYVWTGIYEDIVSQIHGSREEQLGKAALVALEWSDFDIRLGFRSSAGWDRDTLDNVAYEINGRAKRILAELMSLSEIMPVVVSTPTLRIPPLTHTPLAEAGSFGLTLEAARLAVITELHKSRNVTVINETQLAMRSPQANRYDVGMDLEAGCPYTLGHSAALASLAVACLYPSLPKKALITDLDGTLWKGNLGDDGVDGISWSLDGKSQLHALYQKLLASLAETGVLIAVLSKNDSDLVAKAFLRADLLISSKYIFPIEAGWKAKSISVSRILKAWNIDAESVVFVDDSPFELAEVKHAHPGIECLLFPEGKGAEIVALLDELRARFGKRDISLEDNLRLASLRAGPPSCLDEERFPEFLSGLNARLTFEAIGNNVTRSLELVNKTNQFNLNGTRYTEPEWRAQVTRPGSLTLIASYEDRFGPLGRIAVVSGILRADIFAIENWVMSCRAFSRQIEFATIHFLFSLSKGADLQFAYVSTARNHQISAFLRNILPAQTSGHRSMRLSVEAFKHACPNLAIQVIEKWSE